MALSQAVAPRCRARPGRAHAAYHERYFQPRRPTCRPASWDDTVKIWDVETRRELLSLCGHTEKVTCVAFSPDGRFVASSSQDRTVRLWDSATGREVLTLRDPTDRVFGVAYHPDGTRIGAACVDGRLLVFDARTGTLLHDFRTADTGQELYFVAFSPDGTRLQRPVMAGIVAAWILRPGNAIPNHRPVDARFCSGIGFDAFGRCLGFLEQRPVRSGPRRWQDGSVDCHARGTHGQRYGRRAFAGWDTACVVQFGHGCPDLERPDRRRAPGSQWSYY